MLKRQTGIVAPNGNRIFKAQNCSYFHSVNNELLWNKWIVQKIYTFFSCDH